MDKIINSFVYQHVLQTGMPNPNIPAYMSEDYSPGNTQDIIDFLASNNYELVAETDVNLIFKTK